jgi:hypothetical protein
MDKNNIKSLLSKTFVSEATVPGLEVTNKAKGESGKVNKKAIKDVEKKLSDYDKDSKKETKDSTKPVKFNYTDDSESEYHQEMEIMNGQEMIQYDRDPSEIYKKRAEEAIAGSSRMGNNPDWANVVVPGQGGDPTFGKKLVKAIKASEKKRNDGTPTSKMFGDDWEVVADKGHKPYAFENAENNKEIIKEKMKRLTFKKPFNGVNNALNLIPESYRVDNKVFEMTDGEESYRVRWEGSLNEGKAVVLMAADKTLVNEDMQKMKHLMGYKSEETLGNLKGSERINEDKSFGDIWKKTKTILSEGINELTDAQEDTFNMNHGDKPFSDKDFEALRATQKESEMAECGDGMYEDSLYEMNGQNTVRDVQKLDILFDKIGSIKAALDKIDTRAEVIQAVELFVSGLFEKHPELASATKNQLIQTVRDTVDTAIDTSRQPQAEPSMAQMEEGSIYENDRFNEVFGTDGE